MSVAQDNPNFQDIGGQDASLEIPLAEAIQATKPYTHWHFQTHGLSYLLISKKLWTLGHVRRAIEGLPVAALRKKSYYELWAAAMTGLSIEKGLITQKKLDEALGKKVDSAEIRWINSAGARAKCTTYCELCPQCRPKEHCSSLMGHIVYAAGMFGSSLLCKSARF